MKNDLIATAKALLEGKPLHERVQGFNHPDVTQTMLDTISEFDGDDIERLLKWMIEAIDDGEGPKGNDVKKLIMNLQTTHKVWKNRSGN